MNHSEMKMEANNTAIPQTIVRCLFFLILSIIFNNRSRNDFFGSLVISCFAALIVSPLIYYFTFKKKFEIIQKTQNSIKEAYENIGINGFTELMAFSIDNKIEVVRKLLNDGVDVNSINDKGYTALMYASNFGHYEVVKLLLERGADKLIITASGKDALYFAKSKKFRSIEKLINS